MAFSTDDTAVRTSDAGGLREVLDLAYPVVLTQISATAMGVVLSLIHISEPTRPY